MKIVNIALEVSDFWRLVTILKNYFPAGYLTNTEMQVEMSINEKLYNDILNQGVKQMEEKKK